MRHAREGRWLVWTVSVALVFGLMTTHSALADGPVDAAPSAAGDAAEVASQPSQKPCVPSEVTLQVRVGEVSPTPSTSPEPTESATPTPTRSESAPPSASPSVEEAPSPSSTPTEEPEPSPTSEPSASESPSPTSTASPSPSPRESVEDAGDEVLVVCPPQPNGLEVHPGDNSITVTWSSIPASIDDQLADMTALEGHSLPSAIDVVTNVRVAVAPVDDPGDVRESILDGSITSATVSGLRNGVPYSATVMAFGVFGSGPQSEPAIATPTTGADGDVGGVLVKSSGAGALDTDTAEQAVAEVALSNDGRIGEGIGKVSLSEAVDVDSAHRIASALSLRPEVEWAEPDLLVTTAMAPSPRSARMSVRTNQDWSISGEFGIGTPTDPDAGAGVTVAVIDTGVTDHPDLTGRLVSGFDFVSDPAVLAATRDGGAAVPFDGDYAGDFGGLGRDADPRDPGDWRGVPPVRDSSWHGTATASVIARSVPGARIQPIRALSWRGGLISDIADAITWASGGTVPGVSANATPSKIINLSFSVRAACPRTLEAAIDGAVARGSVVVAAAGNAADDAAGYAPGNCSKVLTVGAITADGTRATYSNYGSAVDVSAPGASGSQGREGTSIAAAHTSAVLAVIAGEHPSLSPDSLSELLTGSYLRSFPSQACDDNASRSCGRGLVQIAAALTLVVDSTADTIDAGDGVLTLREAINTVRSDSTNTYTITFDLPNPSTITLTSTLPEISRPVTITGPGQSHLTINGSGADRMIDFRADGVLTDMTLTGSTRSDRNMGNVLLNAGGTSVVRRVTFTGNQTDRVVYNKGANSYLTLEDCTFSNNTYPSAPTALYVIHNGYGGMSPVTNIVTVINSTFTDNDGYAMNITNGADVQDSTFSGNYYAAIFNKAANFSFVRNTVSNNDNGIYVYPQGNVSASATVTDNIFTTNTGAGMITDIYAPATATITGNTFSGNTPNLNYNRNSAIPSSILTTNTFLEASASLSSVSLAFGSSQVGSSVAETITLSNTGSSSMTIDSGGMTISGAAGADYAITGGTCANGATVSASGSCTIVVTFTPVSAGSRSALLSVATSAGTVTASLSGTGAAAPSGGGSDESSGESSSPVPDSTPPGRMDLPANAVIGSGLMLINGQLTPITPQRSPNGGTWTIRGADFSLDFTPDTSGPSPLDIPEEELRAATGSQLEIEGDGYLGGSSVSAYLVPNQGSAVAPRTSTDTLYLGQALVQSDGAFRATFTLPVAIDPGDYVLQVNGQAVTGPDRSVNIPIDVYQGDLPHSMADAAFFKAASAEFSRNGKAKLRRLIDSLPANATDLQIAITGVSVSLGDHDANAELARERSAALKRFLTKHGLAASIATTEVNSAEQVDANDGRLMRSSMGKPLSTIQILYN